jgi:hypothetical protein
MRREIWYREYNISPRDADLFLRSGSGESTSGNGNLTDLNKEQTVKDGIFSGERFYSLQRCHSYLGYLSPIDFGKKN